jgi:hypothetical protein
MLFFRGTGTFEYREKQFPDHHDALPVSEGEAAAIDTEENEHSLVKRRPESVRLDLAW